MFPHARIKSQKLLFFGSRDETGESGNERINGGIYIILQGRLKIKGFYEKNLGAFRLFRVCPWAREKKEKEPKRK